MRYPLKFRAKKMEVLLSVFKDHSIVCPQDYINIGTVLTRVYMLLIKTWDMKKDLPCHAENVALK